MEIVRHVGDGFDREVLEGGEPDRVEREPYGGRVRLHHAAERYLVVVMGRGQRDVVGLRDELDLPPDRRLGRVGVQALPGKIAKGQLVEAGKRMRVMHDGHQLMRQDGNECEIGFVGHARGEHDFVAAELKILDERSREPLGDVDRDVTAVPSPVSCYQRGKIVSLDGVNGPQLYGAGKGFHVLVGDVDALVEGVEGFGDVGVELFAVLREPHRSILSFEQGDSQLFFKLGDGVRQGGLRDVELFGRFRVVLNLGQLLEVIQLG